MAPSQKNPLHLPVVASYRPWTITTGCWSPHSDHPSQTGAGQHSLQSPGWDGAQRLVVASTYSVQGMHETRILSSLVHDECMTSGSKKKKKGMFGAPGAEGKKNKEQVVSLVYEQIMVLCGSDDQSSLVAPSIQSNRAAQMVFAPWEV